MLHIYYRACNSDKPEVRPKYYSKITCLKNFLYALKKIKRYKFTLFFDGKTPKEFSKIVAKAGKIIEFNKVGNSKSFWKVYQKATRLQSNDLVYFVEDDYIHKPDSIEKLLECSNEIKEADYITLLDHPVRYARDYHFGLDVPHRITTIFLSTSHHWRSQESTCMTFAAKVRTLREDKPIFEKYVKQRDVPEDRELFKRLQGLAGYEEDSPFRLLIGPIPSLCTHCHIPWMAPIVDWEEIIKKTVKR